MEPVNATFFLKQKKSEGGGKESGGVRVATRVS